MNYSYIPDPRLLSVKRVTDLTEILHDTPENSEDLNNSYILIASHKVDESTGLKSYKVKVSVFTEILKEYSNSSIVSNEEKLENFLQTFDITTSYENLLDISKNFYSDENGYTYMFVIDPVMAYTYMGEDGKYHLSDGILTYTAVEEYVSNTSSNITIDENHNSFKSGSVTYTLVINSEGQLGFSTDNYNYSALTFSNVSGGKELEYDSPGGQTTLSAKVSKGCWLTKQWNGTTTSECTSANHYNANATISETCNYQSNITTTFNIKAREEYTQADISHNSSLSNPGPERTSDSVEVKYNKYRTWVFVSDGNFNLNNYLNSNNYPTNLPNVVYNNATTSSPQITVTTGTPGYVYLLIRKNWDSKNLYFGSNFPEKKEDDKVGDFNLYTNSTQYILYRSQNSLGSVTFEYK